MSLKGEAFTNDEAFNFYRAMAIVLKNSFTSTHNDLVFFIITIPAAGSQSQAARRPVDQ